MPTNFPTNLDDFAPNPLPTDLRNDPSLAGKVTNLSDAMEAVQAYLGTDDSADPNSITYKVDNSSSARGTYTATTASLTTNQTTTATPVVISPTYLLLTIQTSRPARVRLYTTAAAQTADLSRQIGVDPRADAGVMLDFVTAAGATTYSLSPLVWGTDLALTPDSTIPMTVTNMSTTGTVAVTFNAIELEK